MSKTPTLVVSDTDILIAALTVDGEARGCKQHGRVAVAHSIINRAHARSWYGLKVPPHPDHSLAAVCLKPLQFSCWNATDPNAKRLDELRKNYRTAIKDKNCRASLKALIDALDGFEPDHTGGATHYLTAALHNTKRAPEWSRDKPYVEIDGHRFFVGIK
jgi:N-acetylmuramoyl-L-alanine amidase